MAKELIINASLPEVRIALMEDGRIQELLIERQSDKGIVGNIYKGRVTRVLPGMQAAFVDVGLDKAAFLYVDDIYVHPKVMGEENEVVDDEEELEEEVEIEGIDEGVEAEVDESIGTEETEEGLELKGEAEVSEEEQVTAKSSESDDEETEEADAEAEETEETEELDQADEAFEAAHHELETLPQIQGRNPRGAPQGNAQGSAQARGRNRNRKRGSQKNKNTFAGGEINAEIDLPENFNESVNDGGQVSSDRAQMEGESATSAQSARGKQVKPEFREPRARDRRIKTKHTRPRAQANIADLLVEGQEVIVQIAKDPIATKGARLTCHVSLPGRHLVCMPSIDHVGVSRRIERDDERRRLRDFVERNRPRKMGFIVRTASGGKDPESWIKQDIDYLSKLWGEIRTKVDEVSAPALVYEDLNSILRAIRDWVNEDIDKIIVDSRYHYNELQAFADRFMPSLHEKLELYHGDVPIFDAYGISSELHRSLERKVWLKSGGYLVIDQAEALVAIDVNTGRYVGKKSLEDTILKTNIEAAEEIAHQLRLRNCGGIIICDFIDMERDDNRMRVYRALDEALKKDRARPTIQKISELGLVEMTRKRTRDTIIRTLCEPCNHCEGKGFVKSTTTVAYEILREIERLSVDREAKKILVSAHETVVNVLAIELREALDQLERRYNKSVYLQVVMDYHSEQFEVVTDRMPNKKAVPDIARQLRMERERSERKEKNRSRSKPELDDGSDGGDARETRETREVVVKPHREPRPSREPREPREPREKDEAETREPAPPIVRPSGAFVTTRAGAQTPQPIIQPAVIRMLEKPTQVAVAAGETGASNNEDAQPSFNSFMGEENQQTFQPNRAGYEEELNDEDQLAYLRAQAAQDAAIAGLSQNGANGNRGNQNRGRGDQQGRGNPRSNNNSNRNQNQRGGGRGPHSGNQSQGGQRFKPHHRGPPAVIQANVIAAPVAQTLQAPVEPQIPDYEVISRNDGSES